MDLPAIVDLLNEMSRTGAVKDMMRSGIWRDVKKDAPKRREGRLRPGSVSKTLIADLDEEREV